MLIKLIFKVISKINSTISFELISCHHKVKTLDQPPVVALRKVFNHKSVLVAAFYHNRPAKIGGHCDQGCQRIYQKKEMKNILYFQDLNL